MKKLIKCYKKGEKQKDNFFRYEGKLRKSEKERGLLT